MLKSKNETIKFGIGFSLILLSILLIIKFYLSININYFTFLFPILIFFTSLFLKSPIIIIHYFIELIFIRFISKIINKVIIFSVFYFFFTPLALTFNIFGFSKNFLLYKKKNSYWKKTDLFDKKFDEPF